MIYVILGLIGALAGALFLRGDGAFLLGGAVGVLAAAVILLRQQLTGITRRLSDMESRLGSLCHDITKGVWQQSPAGEEGAQTPPVRPVAQESAPPVVEKTVPHESISRARVQEMPGPPESLGTPVMEANVPLEPPPGPEYTPPPAVAHEPSGVELFVRSFFTGGNLMVRIGVVVLLFGFAFLIKYAAARNLVPLEVRLVAAFASGLALLVLGWRLRNKRFGYAMALQGGGLGIMYLTLFASARLFHMVPLPLTFGVMVALVAFSGVLAVLQNAASMAVLGAAGGFLAPVLLSTGSGNHVMLFSYYALLNAGIFGIAWFRAWRWLNLLGFFFTFGIGSAWGFKNYLPSHFASTEPFLALSFAFYLTIAVLFAFKVPPMLKGYVDGTLVFGLPLVVFGLQAPMVERFEYGLAFSALAMGLIYITLATALWRHRTKEMGPLVEAFLALGVVFASLAIPLALSGHWTAVAWSLEGAGLVWVGVRQRRLTARLFGLLLQFGAGFLFLAKGGGVNGMAVVNSRFLGGMMVGVAALVSAFFLERYQPILRSAERPAGAVILAWGLLWWFGTGFVEIDRRLDGRYELQAVLTFAALSCAVMGRLWHRLNWNGLRWPVAGLLPFMLLICIMATDRHSITHPFQGWWLGAWPTALAVHYILLFRMSKKWPRLFLVPWHVAGGLMIIFLLSREAAWALDIVGNGFWSGRVARWRVHQLASGVGSWQFIAWGMVPALCAWLLKGLNHRFSIAPDRAYSGWLPFLIMAGLLAWSFTAPASNGDFGTFAYLPLLNPLDVVQAFVLMTLIYWCRSQQKTQTPPVRGLDAKMLWGAPALGAFVWLTAIVARTVHHWSHVPYDMERLFDSDYFQASISILWGLLALGTMVTAHRLKSRTVWFTGAFLLTVVVIKLFLIDLSGTGTIARIVSFLAVGGLMLIIGFFTPLPPAVSKGEPS